MTTKTQHTTNSADQQMNLPFGSALTSSDNPAIWTPRDIWVRLNAELLAHFKEDRRLDFKGSIKVDFNDLATYMSAFSNTPDGGLLVYGVNNSGKITGCSSLPQTDLNRIESCHTQMCPMAKPEFKRVPVTVEGKSDFCIAVFIPYIGKLVETNQQEAWIRYGDTRHKMSEEEKRDFRSTRQELSFEQERAAYDIPSDFDTAIIEDFCANFRNRETASTNWTNDEILIDRKLAVRDQNGIKPTNALVLLAARDPGKTIPGCRVRIQRFEGAVEGTGSNYSPLKDKFVEGNVVNLIRKAEKEIESLIYNVTWLNRNGRFETTQEYPRWAWYEALVNACVHRSYNFSGTEITVKLFEDRLEIESPGGFVPPVNEQNLYQTRASRNHHFMDAMRYLGYVQMAREGTRRIRETMTTSELPEPVFKQESLHGIAVKVTLFNDHLTRKRATDRDVALFFGVETWRQMQEHEVQLAAYTYRNKTINVSDAARVTGRTWSTSKKDLERLLQKGVLDYVPGAYPRDPSAHYRLKNKN